MKLLIVDLDGTLFDTKDVNYYAYKEAILSYGYSLEYQYYCEFCNGRHYTDFLPLITTTDETILSAIHNAKKKAYSQYLNKAVLNRGLLDIIKALRKSGYKTAVVTNASKENCREILDTFNIIDIFDLILTQDDIEKAKPDPEGFLKAMQYFKVKPEETVIFEDSDVGIEAAERSGAFYYRTYRFN